MTKPVRALFELVRMHKIFDIYVTKAEALQALGSEGGSRFPTPENCLPPEIAQPIDSRPRNEKNPHMSVQAVTNTLGRDRRIRAQRSKDQRDEAADERGNQEIGDQRDPEHGGQQRLAVQEVGDRARRDAQRDPVPAGDRELLEQDASRLRETDLPHGHPPHHDGQGLDAGVPPCAATIVISAAASARL